MLRLVAEAPPPPVIVAIPSVAAIFTGIMMFLLVYPGQIAWRHTLRAVLVRIANISIVGHKFFGFVGDAVAAVDLFFTTWLQGAERMVVWGLHTLMWSIRMSAQVVADLADATERMHQRILHALAHTTPKVIHETIVKPADKATKAAITRLRARTATLEKDFSWTKARLSALAAAIPHALPHLPTRVGAAEKGLRDAEKWLTKHRWLAKYASLAALGAAILARLGLGWTRCTNVNKVGKRLCATNPSWIDEFLSATILIAGTTSFVEFVKEAQDGYELGIEGLKLFIREL